MTFISSMRQARCRGVRLSFRWSAPVVALPLLFAIFLEPVAAAAQRVWDRVEIVLPSGFHGNYSTNEDHGRGEFLFGHPRNLYTFGWLERAPRKLRKASVNKVSRHVKSELRANGFRVVPRSERRIRGRWSADFTGRSAGDDFRRRVTIIPLRDGWLIGHASSLRRAWETSLAAKMREIVLRLRVLD